MNIYQEQMKKNEYETDADFWQSVSTLDPLNASEKILALPRLNQRGDTTGIVSALVSILPTEACLSNWSDSQAAAAMRDIGLFLGSLKRHGMEPEEVIGELSLILKKLGEKTCLPPRDTLLHYVLGNTGTQLPLRTYTKFPKERILIEMTRSGYHALLSAMSPLKQLFHTSVCESRFSVQCEIIVECLNQLSHDLGVVYQKLGAEFFVKEIRPYFESIRVDGDEYLGPGAVGLPLFVIDQLLWSSCVDDAEYTGFKESHLASTLPTVRELYFSHKNKQAVVDRVIVELKQLVSYGYDRDAYTLVSTNLQSLNHIFKKLLSFRKPHLKLAQNAYQHTPEVRFEKGSGGYHPDILIKVLNHTLAAERRLKQAQQQFEQHAVALNLNELKN